MNRGSNRHFRLFGWLLFLSLFFFLGGRLSSNPGNSEEQAVQAVKQVLPSVVSISTYRPDSEEGIGSGVIISSSGYILTNTHVIRGAQRIKVTLSSKKSYNAVIWRASNDRDLAVIKINAEEKLPVPRFGDSDKLQLGQTAISLGNPLRFTWTVTAGIISALNREVTAKGIRYNDLIQTDAAINRGSSGGALINLKGEVIGINALVYSGAASQETAQGLSFAIPINQAYKVARDLIQEEKPGTPKPWIGIYGRTITQEFYQSRELPVYKGVYITEVIHPGPAAAAGVKPGDVVVEVGGKLITRVEDLKSVIKNASPGQQLEFTLWQKDKKNKVKIKVEQLSQ